MVYLAPLKLDTCGADIHLGSGSTTDPRTHVLLTRLYTLADRLQAPRFKHRVLESFYINFNNVNMDEQTICRLLEIVAEELPDFLQRDALRSQILWCAASNLEKLQRYDGFDKLLAKLPDLGRWLCQWAGNTTKSKPARQGVSFEGRRFAAEDVPVD